MVLLNTHPPKEIFFNVDPLKESFLKKPTLSKELFTIFYLEKSVSDKMVFMNLHFEIFVSTKLAPFKLKSIKSVR